MKGSDFTGLAEVIPQLSYEIVGRIIPGIIVILSLVIAVMGWDDGVNFLVSTLVPSLSSWFVVLLILSAYTLAYILDGIWQIFEHLRKKEEERPNTPSYRDPSISLKFDKVNQQYPKVGAWMTKLYAESNNAQELIVGWLLCVLLNTYYLLFFTLSTERLLLEFILLILIIGAVFARQSITKTRDTTLENHWYFMNEPDTQQKTPGQDD